MSAESSCSCSSSELDKGPDEVVSMDSSESSESDEFVTPPAEFAGSGVAIACSDDDCGALK